MALSDKDIIDGLKRRDGEITKEYFYNYCRVAYFIYQKKYNLLYKPGLDFYSLAHEYYLSLCKHDFRQLEDHAPNVSLKTWMVNGFRYVLLDKLKEVEKEGYTERFEERVERSSLRFDVVDDNYAEEVRNTILEICHQQLGRDSKDSLILQMSLIEGFKGKEIATELGLTPSAISQRYSRLMQDVVIPYFKAYFIAPSSIHACKDMDICEERVLHDTSSQHFSKPAIPYSIMDYTNRITPEFISELRENEIFVFGSNLAGMHGGGAARTARLHFGAVMGEGVGLQGQSYAIPTMQGDTDTIRPYVDDFIAFAKAHPEQKFLVTRIGCGIAGFSANDIAPLFQGAREVENICLPQDFWDYFL